MLRGWRIKSGRWMAILVAVGALIVFLLWAAVAGAQYIDIMVDGDCSDWTDGYVKTDPDEATIPNVYDIGPISATLNTSGTQHFIGYHTLSDLYIMPGAFMHVFYDTDHNAATGYPVSCPEGGSVGAERRVLWHMDTDACEVYRHTGGSTWQLVATDCDGEPHGSVSQGVDTGSTCLEMGSDSQDLALDGSDLIAVFMLFENGDLSGPDDDRVCFDYDVPTAVELSSFTACPERARPSEPWPPGLWPVALLGGAAAVSAGGLVLWKRKEPTP